MMDNGLHAKSLYNSPLLFLVHHEASSQIIQHIQTRIYVQSFIQFMIHDFGCGSKSDWATTGGSSEAVKVDMDWTLREMGGIPEGWSFRLVRRNFCSLNSLQKPFPVFYSF
jgi:hypothetical protein